MARLFPSARPSADLFRSFSFDRVIGEGQFGRVWRCVHLTSGNRFACKQIRKSRLSEHDFESLKGEVASMERLRGHRHVLQLLALFEDEKTVYMVTDLCDVGDMFALVSQANGLPEQAAAVIFSQIADAVRWCHVHGIVHRDIKPENVLLDTRTSDNGKTQIEACLGDFGLALQIPKGYMIRGSAGSAPYEAPEVVSSQPYGVTADVWSLGVLLYATLSAKLPSFPSNKRELIPKVDFSVSPWSSISEEAKDLIRRMMTVDSTQRLDIQEVLQHPWITGRVPAANGRRTCVVTQQAPSLRGQPIKRTKQDGVSGSVSAIPAAHWLLSPLPKSPLPRLQKASSQAQCDNKEGAMSPRSQPSSKRRLLDWMHSSSATDISTTPHSPSSPSSPLSPLSPLSPSSPLSSSPSSASSPRSSPSSPLSSPSSSPDLHSLPNPRLVRHYSLSPLAPRDV
ncbi:hypothetical protein CLOM_g23600 [Closterium sp. NIES-68]|nr:hypothetical protein CLOM_g23600 [Closterium sp. NIES-68]GJP83315.1 hypothetical protein CLOP_g13477 [Closterium sp. NIES-67]